MAVTPQDNADFGEVPDLDETDAVEEVAAPEDESTDDPTEDTVEAEDEGSTEEQVDINVDELGGHYVTVKIDGKDVKLTLKEALSGVMRQQDYTRKTQEIATERERLASFSRLAEALEEDPAWTLRVLQRALGVDGAADLIEEVEELDPTEARLQRIERLAEQQEQEARNRTHIIAAETAISSTEGLDVDAGELLQFAVENNVLNLDKAAHFLLLEKRAAAKTTSREADIEAAKVRKRAAAVVESGHSRAPGTTAPAKAKKMSLREAFEAAKLSQSQVA